MNNKMSIIIRCDCGNVIDLRSTMVGNQFSLGNQLRDSRFRLSTLDIEKSGDLEEIEDVDEIDVELGNIRIDCQECGSFIEIDDFE